MDSRFLRSNLLILFAYAVLIHVFAMLEGSEPATFVIMGMMVMVGLHVLVLLIGTIVKFVAGYRRQAGNWALNVIVVAIIGLGTCFGGGMLLEKISQDETGVVRQEQAP